MRYRIQDESLTLLAEGAVFWEREAALIVADVHLGKAIHFRQAGIAAPLGHDAADLSRLADLVSRHQAKRLIILGDWIHSRESNDQAFRERLKQWRAGLYCAHVDWVLGNHDRIDATAFASANIAITQDALDEPPFCFSHTPRKDCDRYGLNGHLHPCLKLTFGRRERAYVKCFHFRPDSGTLPAFGTFTGNHPIQPGPNDRVFAIIDEKVLSIGHKSCGQAMLADDAARQ